MVCVYYRIDDIEILDLSELATDPYITTVVKSSIPKVFLKSKGFISLFEERSWWLTEERPWCLTGPKGVGKTLCLLALMNELKKKGTTAPIFVSSESFQEVNQNLSLKYLQEVANTIGFFHTIDSTHSVRDWLLHIMQCKKASKQPLLFMDFDKLDDSKIVKSMSTVARFCSNSAILAVSSGHMAVTEESFLLLLHQKYRPFRYLPFSRTEMDYFIKYHHIKFTTDNLLPITGYNPCLLSLVSNCEDLNEAISIVDSYVHLFVQHNLKVSVTLPRQFLGSLKRSEEYFWMASVNDTLQDDARVEFDSSWIAKNQVCYLEDKTMKLNFPRLPQILQADIQALVQNNSIDISPYPQVRGYMAEDLFFEYARDGEIVVHSSSACIKFRVNQVQQMHQNVGNLTENVLYRLNMYHPVIDAVGLLSPEGGTFSLVYFQVSISSYDDHNMKITDLFVDKHQNSKYPELTKDCKTLHDYYSGKVVRTLQDVYYIYISTETTKSNLGSRIKNDAQCKGISYAVLSTDQPLYKEMKLI